MAMTEEGIIIAVEVTDGAQPDGKQLPKLIEKSVQNGVDAKEIIGDLPYVSNQNLAVCKEKDITLYAKTNSAVAAAAECDLDEGYWLNKDAAALQCPAGELSVKATKKVSAHGNEYLQYRFDKKDMPKMSSPRSMSCGKIQMQDVYFYAS